MSGPGDFWRRPFGEQPPALRLALGAAAAAAIVLLAVLATTGGKRSAPTASPVLTEEGHDKAEEDRSPIDRGALARAEATARSFARGYLAVLYGRAEAAAIGGTTDALRRRVDRELIRVPPTRAKLRPRIVALRLFPRGSTTATAEALVDDRDAPRYPVRFLLGARGQRWVVTTLLND